MSFPLLVGFLSLGVMVVLAGIGVPVALAAGLVGVVGLIYDIGFSGTMGIIATLPNSVLSNFGISLIPLFFLMGTFAAQAGIAKDAFDSAYKVFGRMRGGLAMATTVGSALSAATMGSSLANAALFTKIALPPMLSYNYNKSFALGCITAVGTFAIMIPPSITFVLYGIVTGQSIGALLLAGIVPGIVTAVVYLIFIYFRCRLNPDLAPVSTEKFSIREKLSSITQLWTIFLLFFLVMGGVYAGYFTPSAGGAVGALGALILAVCKRRLSWKMLKSVGIETAQSTTAIMMIVLGAFFLARHLILSGFTTSLVSLCTGDGANIPGWVVILLLAAMYLVLGCFMETVSMLVTTMPFVYPVVTALGYDGIWFGVIFVKLAELGMLTPPIGANLAVVSATAENTSMIEVAKGVLPFVLLEIPILAILIYFPELSTYLPSRMYGK